MCAGVVQGINTSPNKAHWGRHDMYWCTVKEPYGVFNQFNKSIVSINVLRSVEPFVFQEDFIPDEARHKKTAPSQ